MAYIPNTPSGISVYLTKRAKDYIISGDIGRLSFDRIAIGDSDIDYRNTANLPPAGKVPDVSGEFLGCIQSTTSNTDIKNKVSFLGEGAQPFADIVLNQTGDRGFRFFRRFSGLTTLAQGGYGYTYANRTLTGDTKSHMFSTFSLPITDTQKSEFDAAYNNTAIQYINNDEIIFANIPKTAYQDQIDGKTLYFSYPDGSGGSIDVYGRYFNNQSLTEPLNTYFSETLSFASEFGSEQTSTDNFNTNVVFLFSDNIAPPISGGSWSDTQKYPTFSDTREAPKCDTVTGGTFVDKCVGIAYLDKGFAVLTHPDLIGGFPFGDAKNLSDGTPYGGGQDFTDIYFDDGLFQFRSFANAYLQSLNYIIPQNGFNESNNPTFQNGNGDNIYITEFGAYNSDNELILLAKFDEPIEKRPELDSIPISLKIFL